MVPTDKPSRTASERWGFAEPDHPNDASAQAETTDTGDAACGPPPTSTIPLLWAAPSYIAIKGIVHAPATTPAMKPESRDALLGVIAKERRWAEDLRLVESPLSPRSPGVKDKANGTSACWLRSPSFRPHHCGDRRWNRACGSHGRINPIVTGVLADLRDKLASFYSDTSYSPSA